MSNLLKKKLNILCFNYENWISECDTSVVVWHVNKFLKLTKFVANAIGRPTITFDFRGNSIKQTFCFRRKRKVFQIKSKSTQMLHFCTAWKNLSQNVWLTLKMSIIFRNNCAICDASTQIHCNNNYLIGSVNLYGGNKDNGFFFSKRIEKKKKINEHNIANISW